MTQRRVNRVLDAKGTILGDVGRGQRQAVSAKGLAGFPGHPQVTACMTLHRRSESLMIRTDRCILSTGRN